ERYPARRGYPAEGSGGLLGRLAGQSGGQQRRAAVDGQLGKGLAEFVVAIPCLVKVGQRLRKVTTAQRGQSAIMPGLRVFEFLFARREEFLGPGEVRGGPPGETEPEKDLGSMGQRPCLPHLVVRPAEVRKSSAQVLMGLVESAQVAQHVTAPHE